MPARPHRQSAERSRLLLPKSAEPLRCRCRTMVQASPIPFATGCSIPLSVMEKRTGQDWDWQWCKKSFRIMAATSRSSEPYKVERYSGSCYPAVLRRRPRAAPNIFHPWSSLHGTIPAIIQYFVRKGRQNTLDLVPGPDGMQEDGVKSLGTSA